MRKNLNSLNLLSTSSSLEQSIPVRSVLFLGEGDLNAAIANRKLGVLKREKGFQQEKKSSAPAIHEYLRL
jgi:hypothetical protein